jgi:uncharacterized protein YtpQ (UPF0354 family)
LVTEETMKASKGAMLGQMLVDGLYVTYVVDGDRTIAHIPEQAFDKWKIELDIVHDRAIENLMTRSTELAADAARDEQGNTNLVLFQVGDGYDSSRLLLPTLHERLRGILGSPFLAAIPNRDILICIRKDAEILASVKKQIAQDYRTMPRQITEQLILVTADGLAPFSEMNA